MKAWMRCCALAALWMALMWMAGCAVAEEWSLLIMPCAEQPMAEDAVPPDLVALAVYREGTEGGVRMASSSTRVSLAAEAAAALERLCGAAEKEGVILYARQGYRSYQDEQKLFDRLTSQGRQACRPGESDYQTGLAVTLVDKEHRAGTLDEQFGETAASRWMAENGARFGFVLRYPEGKQLETGWPWEPWHLRYVGEEAALIMQMNHLCLEEYREMTGSVLLAGYSQQTIPTPAWTEPAFTPDPNDWLVVDEIDPDGDYEYHLIPAEEKGA